MALLQGDIKACIIFEIKLETGKNVLKTEEDKPPEITIGEGTLPKSIEDALVNMKEGKTKEIKLRTTGCIWNKIR